MKKFISRPIKASTEEIDTIYNGAFSDIAYAAEKLGYKMTISKDGKYKMTLTCEVEKDLMPEIKVNTVEEKGTYFFNPDVKFPELKYDDMEYADSVHYVITDKWEPIAKFITKLNKFGYSPEDEEAVEEE